MNDLDLDISADPAAHALALAECLDGNEETTLGPTDSRLAVVALRHYRAFIDANTP